MVEAVIFDVFGTVLEIKDRQNPYRQLLRIGAEQGRAASSGDLRLIMALNGGLKEAAAALGIRLASQEMAGLQRALELELASIRLFEDTSAAINLLRVNHVQIGVCSNLAGPYCSQVRRLLPDLDAYALSAECGVMKPDRRIYQTVCAMLGIEDDHLLHQRCGQIVMIGDSRKCDEQGPLECGIKGFHLDRSGAGRFSNLVDFSREVLSDNVNSCPG